MPMERPPRKPKRTHEKTEMRQQQLQQDLSLLTTSLVGEPVRLEVLVVLVVGNSSLLVLVLL